MKAASAIALLATLFAAHSFADTPAPAASTQVTAAPSSVTSTAAIMARAFRSQAQTCSSESPGQRPVLAPAPVNQASCMLPRFDPDQWARCPVFPAAPVVPLAGGLGVPPVNQQPSYIVGDRFDGTQNGVSTINGSVQLDQGDRRVTAEHMTYDSRTGVAVVQKGIVYANPGMVVTSPSGVYDTQAGSGTFKDTTFLLPKRNGHGTASIFNSLDDDHNQLYGTTYTTCPPDKVDWLLSAPDMYLDTSTNTGEGHDVTIHFLGMPVFWTPYLNFPLNDQRKSGFLGATFSFDVINGFVISAPYYLNLADNYDATLFPHIITKRGLQTGAEFRWLDGTDSGMVYGDYLSHDKVEGSERGQFILRDTASFNEFNRVDTDYNWVSDDNYFRDLGSDLTVNSTSTLPRYVSYTYDDGADWIVASQFQDFQVVDPSIPPIEFPYRRIPQVVVNWSNNEAVTGPQYSFYAEGVRFQRDLRIGTWRSDVKPSISLPISDSAAYFTPTLAWRYTAYDLNADAYRPDVNQPVITVADRHLSRSLPIFDIDTGLNFERDAGTYTQTLEPRLYYLRVPYRDQNQIPVFDAVEPEFGYPQLFSDNRFYGADRQSDANQMSYALTTRFLDSLSGAQVFQADIGQTRYFATRRVQLPGTPADTSLYSDVVGDALYNINDVWTAYYNQLWNPTTRQTDLGSVLLQYHPAYHQVLNLGYEFRRPDLKQTTVSFAWPLAGPWSWVGGWNYDVVNHQTLERILGFEYDSCCWNFQILNRFYLMPNSTKYDSVFFFSLQLKGLGQVGRHLEDLLQRDILGYTNAQFDEPLQPEESPPPQ